jgi:hypothetical protein
MNTISFPTPPPRQIATVSADGTIEVHNHEPEDIKTLASQLLDKMRECDARALAHEKVLSILAGLIFSGAVDEHKVKELRSVGEAVQQDVVRMRALLKRAEPMMDDDWKKDFHDR